MAATYRELFGREPDNETIKATFEVVYIIGWAPDATQPLPRKRGSATMRIGELPKEPSPP